MIFQSEARMSALAKLRELGAGRRPPSDELFAAGDALLRPYAREGVFDIDDEALCHRPITSFPCEAPGCREVFESLLDFELHYKSRHTYVGNQVNNRFTCRECRKPLPSAHLLDLHISESHDSFFAAQAERKPMFRCFVEDCTIVSIDAAARKAHCVDAHAYPTDFRYDRKTAKNKKKTIVNEASMPSGSEPMSVDEVTKQLNQFAFGHSRKKTFSAGHCARKKSTSKSNLPKKNEGAHKNKNKNENIKISGESSNKAEQMEF